MRKPSEYGLQLREKQKVRRAYGLMESQFHRTFKKAEGMKGITGENLLQLLERRLDNVVYRSGLANSRAQARQFVCHGLITVSGKKVDIPSYITNVDDVIGIKETRKGYGTFQDRQRRDQPRSAQVDRDRCRSVDRENRSTARAGGYRSHLAGEHDRRVLLSLTTGLQ